MFRSVYSLTDLTGIQKSILTYLIHASSPEKEVSETYDSIAEDVSFSSRTVKSAISVLIEKGYLEKKLQFGSDGSNLANLYRVRSDIYV